MMTCILELDKENMRVYAEMQRLMRLSTEKQSVWTARTEDIFINPCNFTHGIQSPFE